MSNNQNNDVRTVVVQLENQEKGIKIDSKKRTQVFVLLALLNIVLNMDHGTIPASSNEIMAELKIQETTLGSFGSLVYLGCLIGSLFLVKLIDSTNRKTLSILSTLFNAALIFSFTKIDNVPFLFFNRIMVGVMQSYLTIYMPVWIDQFGMKSWKTIMMAVFNITSPLGVVIGFIMTMTIKVNFNVFFFCKKKVENVLHNSSYHAYQFGFVLFGLR